MAYEYDFQGPSSGYDAAGNNTPKPSMDWMPAVAGAAGLAGIAGGILGGGGGWNGSYRNIVDAKDYGFTDYNGNMQGAYDRFMNEANFNQAQMGQYAGQVGNVQSNYDPNAYMNQFLNSTGGLANAVSGQNSQLQQSLNAIASRQAAEGVNAQAQNFAGMGALNSGAAMAAMGDAMAQPFAQVQSQLQQNQLQGTLGLYNNAMGNYAQGNQFGAQNQLQAGMANQNANLGLAGMYAGNYQNNMGQLGGLAGQFGGSVAPQYEYQQGKGSKLGAAATGALGGAAAGSALGPWGAAAGGIIGGLGGFFS